MNFANSVDRRSRGVEDRIRDTFTVKCDNEGTSHRFGSSYPHQSCLLANLEKIDAILTSLDHLTSLDQGENHSGVKLWKLLCFCGKPHCFGCCSSLDFGQQVAVDSTVVSFCQSSSIEALSQSKILKFHSLWSIMAILEGFR